MTRPPPDPDIAAMLDEARGAQAASERSRERWLRQQAMEEAQLSGVLVAAAEQSAMLTVRTTAGQQHRGTVASVGADHCVLAAATGTATYVRFEAVAVVLPDRGLRPVPAADDRTGTRRTRFIEAIAARCRDQPEVAMRSSGQADPVVGRLVAVGTDVATLQVDQRPSVAYISLASVTEVSFLASG